VKQFLAALSGIPQPVSLGMVMAAGVLIGTTVRPRP
jgi:hypothetical protein